MELFISYVVIFTITTLIGVPLLSATQFIFIHNKTFAEWAPTFGTTFLFILLLIFLISLFAFFALRPALPIAEKAKKENLSREEKLLFAKTFSNLEIVTFFIIFAGYFIGNVSLFFIKAGRGDFSLGNTQLEKTTMVIVVLIQCLAYALMAINYSINCYSAYVVKYIERLKINDLEGMKVKNFTLTLGKGILYSSFFFGWNIFLAAYQATVYGSKGLPTFLHTIGVVTVLLLLYVLPCLWIILLNFRKRLQAATKTIKSIHENGDLSEKINISGFDQFGENQSEINKMIESLRMTISNIRNQSSNVSNNARTLLNTSENSAAGVNQIIVTLKEVAKMTDKRDSLLSETQVNIENLTEDAKRISNLFAEQTAETEKNAASITEMVANINSIGDMVKKQKDLAVNLAQLSENGNQEVSGTLQLIYEITEKSKQMMEVTTVIESVAEQTNLLAMNAAIEAAHAGESGKGFAVVADEIRKLAESTSESTQNIKNMISQLAESISGSSEKINSTSKAFDEMNTSIQTQLELVETISNAAEEQSVGAQETLTATNEISNQIGEINSLINKQADYTASIDQGIKDVVVLSEQVNEALKESENLIVDFSKSVEQNKDNALENESNINGVNTELNKFVL